MFIVRSIIKKLKEEMEKPSEDFVKLICADCHEGRITQKVIVQYKGLIQSAAKELKKEHVNDLMTAIEEENEKRSAASLMSTVGGIETTEEEIFGHRIVQAICAKVASVDRIHLRDSKTYCAIIFDDNNRKPLMRMYFNGNKKAISYFDKERNEVKMPVEHVSDIYKYEDFIRETAQAYL
jgi:hypothetical protein